jgi:hypothetical protein
MWQAHYETTTDISAEKLYQAITDINNWNKWDNGLEFTKLEGIAKRGASFTLKPKGEPTIRMTIDEIQPYHLIHWEIPRLCRGISQWIKDAQAQTTALIHYVRTMPN